MYAKVIVEYPVKTVDKTYIYKVPKDLEKTIKIGHKVLIYFGAKIVNGFVLELTNFIEVNYEYKYILKIVDPDFVLNKELIELGLYMSLQTLATKISCFQCMLPTGFKVKNNSHNYKVYDKYLVINKPLKEVNLYIENNKRSKKKIEILNQILLEDRVNKKSMSNEIYNSLIESNLVKEVKERVYRIKESIEDEFIHTLTDKQKEVVDNISLERYNTHLLFGVTGSGKTEVYLDIIQKVLNSGKTAILLSPEISLTMQLVKRLYARFKDNVAVLHSALSSGERHDEYQKIYNKKVSVVVGTRSAIFAPLENIGVIIIDEEHSITYKQDNNPRYNAKDMALFRAKYYNIPLVLGSATPSLETMTKAVKNIYKLHVLNCRINNNKMPLINIVDMNKEVKKNNFLLSEDLINRINEKIFKDEQIILLLNRRGYSTYISCSNCGYTYKCPNCNISLTYHKTTNNLMCHYCGYLTKKSSKCPKCNEESLNYLGIGTQKIEEYIKENILNAKVLRMDQDTTTKKGSHDKIIQSFKNKEYNILLGTQMISKGLDFKDVTLVGVINADTTLNIPDYKASENTFALLSQVSGRSGRSKKEGEVIIQTYKPDNYIINCVKDNSYRDYYINEMNFRKLLKYPPYYNLVGIKIISKDYSIALSQSKKAVLYLKNKLDAESIVLGPTTASLLKYKNSYRFQIIIKYKKDKQLKDALLDLEQNILIDSKVSIEFDFNPTTI